MLPNPNQNGWYQPGGILQSRRRHVRKLRAQQSARTEQVNFDFSAIKDFRITESQALQFRMEMFNAPNHVELGTPVRELGRQFECGAAVEFRRHHLDTRPACGRFSSR